MIYIFLSLAGGVAIGYLFPPGEARSRIIQRLTMTGLFILLAAMGAQLGSNDKVLANLDRIGLQAFVLAAFSVAGSVLAVFAIFRWLEAGKSGDSRKRGI
ncbi:MAG: hypothetical protein JL50_02285 [Peptococcaceae bacterium BICA1-7]|nr:MAG: hypothetical protein JL50_02285 [Peptococcaceae bacterium BICA1-7]HBV95456.1 DUF340 domain-containing protein [Desulfotomaculum sp.]